MVRRKHLKSSTSTGPGSAEEAAAAEPRIIGGKFRGRKLLYLPDHRTRPMKDRVREAVFNLVGPAIKGKYAIDLFAGTGALGLEAISRGAIGATFVERHFPTADLIRRNAAVLECADVCTVLPANVLLWPRRWPQLPESPWVVFCSPPWDLYGEEPDAMYNLLEMILDRAPATSQVVVETDERVDFKLLPRPGAWDVRTYLPAQVGILTT
jgi:16S rRNA (guanine(966)-N(2))-methyltransferase RsmD